MEVNKMKLVQYFVYMGGDLDDETLQGLLTELFPAMKTIIDEDGCLRLYITKEEYVFVLNELTKLSNYMLSMPEYYEDTNTTLLSQPIEANICDRYGRIYDAIFAFHYKTEFVDKAADLDMSYPLNGKLLSGTFDLDNNFQTQLDNRFKDKYLK